MVSVMARVVSLRILTALVLALSALPAAAETFTRIGDRDTFLQTVQGRELRLAMFGVTLEVQPDGQIVGEAMGWPLTGRWDWRDGYFCREMDWSGYEITANCQLVEANGSSIRFVVDRGAGRAASFRLR